ncbi:hypothetical protein [Actinomadura sp. J1-007]|uniref:hypothetical protein n=1 Tax=Actinomadura sp. J1-007 TaxID=2661913 RepID=UPI001F4FDD18|nr:hypothetical protein [Actinomadura sp. J1-007]
MSAIRSTTARTALLTVPLALGVLSAVAAPAGAATASAKTAEAATSAGAATSAEAATSVGAASRHGKSLTCRGEGVDPNARVRYRTQTVINAPLKTIWRLQTDVERWPAWQSPSTPSNASTTAASGRARRSGGRPWRRPPPPLRPAR